LLPTPAAGPAANAAVNPFTYDGAYTDPGTGTQYLPARTYDPSQGRFLSQDAASQLNRYQAFDTNPSTDTDPTGQLAVPQIVTDVAAAVLFLIFGILSWGSLAPVFVAAEISTAAAVGAVLNGISAVANLAAAATTATLVANDAYELAGTGFLSDSQKEDLTNASFGLGLAAGLTGAAAGAAGAAGLTDTLVTAANAGKGAGKVAQVAENVGPDLGPVEQNLNPNPAPAPPVEQNPNLNPDPENLNLNPNNEPTGDNNGQLPGTGNGNADPAQPEQTTDIPNVDLNPQGQINPGDEAGVNQDGQPVILPEQQINNLPNGVQDLGNQVDEPTEPSVTTNNLQNVSNVTDVATATGEKELNENITEEIPATSPSVQNLDTQSSTIPLITPGLDPNNNGL
jgi:RHS repeat-associated protein